MLNLEISQIMSTKEGLESKLIRMSESLRNKFNLSLGEFINVQNTILQVDRIYAEDFVINADKAYVTQTTFQKFKSSNVTFEIPKHVTLGCDPEFFLVDYKTNTLFNPAVITKKQNPVGYDGMLMELRPGPSIKQKEVVSNLFDLIQETKTYLINKNVAHLNMIARSSGWGCFSGFHVHLGLPNSLLNPLQPNFGKILRIITKALDYYVSTLCILVEKDDSVRRCSPYINYGKVSDFRVNTNTLEYRVPGGALLKHPKLTQGLLGMCSLVVHDLIERIRICTNNYNDKIYQDEDTFLKGIYPNILPSADMYGIICVPTTAGAEKEAVKILDDFKYMANYKVYEEDIKTFMSLCYANLSNNIWKNWKQMVESN